MKNYLLLQALAVTIIIVGCNGKGYSTADTTKTDSVRSDTTGMKEATKPADSALVDVFDPKSGNKIGSKIMPIHRDTAKKDTVKKK